MTKAGNILKKYSYIQYKISALPFIYHFSKTKRVVRKTSTTLFVSLFKRRENEKSYVFVV